jgi:hypothetical protein
LARPGSSLRPRPRGRAGGGGIGKGTGAMKIESDEWLFEHAKYDPLKDKWLIKEGKGRRGYKFGLACEICGDSFLFRENKSLGPWYGKFCSLRCLGDYPDRNKMLSAKAKKQWEKGELLEPVREGCKKPERNKKISESRTGDKHPRYSGHRKFMLYDIYAHYLPKDERRPDPGVLFRGKEILQIRCKKCGIWFKPGYFQVWRRIYALEGKHEGESNFYCSENCKRSCDVYKTILYRRTTSPHRTPPSNREWRDMVQTCAEGLCEICGKKGKIAHHIIPVAKNNLVSEDYDNGLWLCKDCHTHIVHSLPDCRFHELKRKLCKD